MRDRTGRKVKSGGEDFVGRLMKDEGMSRDAKMMNSMMSNNSNLANNTNNNTFSNGGFNSHNV